VIDGGEWEKGDVGIEGLGLRRESSKRQCEGEERYKRM